MNLRASVILILSSFLLLGCHSFEMPAEIKDVRIESIEHLAIVGFDRTPDIEDGELRGELTEDFNAALEEAGANPESADAYKVTFTRFCLLFEAQRFSLNQFNPFSRDAYLFAKDAKFGCLFRVRVTQNGREVLPETTFQHVSDGLFYFERSSKWWWIVTFTMFPYYDYYYYDAEVVLQSMVTRVLDKLVNEILPKTIDGAASPTSANSPTKERQS